MLSGRYLYRPGGPPPTPTHALGSRPSRDRFAVSASRNPSTPDFSDVLQCCAPPTATRRVAVGRAGSFNSGKNVVFSD